LPDPAEARLNLSAGLASIAVALILVAAKSWAWIATGSLAVAASLIDSCLDMLVSLANFAAILYAAKPADEDHRFGHHAIEDIAAMAQAVLVAAAALMLGWRGIDRLADPEPLAAEGAGIAVMVLAILLSAALVWWQRRVARRTGSKVVAADSLHYLSDLLPAVGSIAALGASALFGVVRLDSLISLIAAAVLLRGAWRIGSESFAALMDQAAPDWVATQVAEAVAEFPEIAGFHDLKTRVSGTQTFIQLHIEIEGTMSLADAHEIGARLRRRLLERVPRSDVLVHLDPLDDPFAASAD
jgi:ferrous-iron efflux pump FieF